ncbi:MAG TPA: hypothetical protein VFO93_14780 [Hymenobacter sp.]|uniref:hypothetical protein n=1 Tax=Hymenobacter sp. TaxID=1898978 RepID=UPI002D7FA276|nr:hypothetical protein [Hymenobacter sp.]HET9504806.1 hypothetical protein [Hymenobacter sp.]
MNFSISIPRPCAENWGAMTPASGGRHCAACQQTVVDFSQQTDAEILAYFQRAGVGGTCGRFRASQVGRPLAARSTQPPRQWQPWLAGVLAAVLVLQACDPATRVAPRPPLAHAQPPTLTSATVTPAELLAGDTTLAVNCPTDSLLAEHINNLVQGFTVTPEAGSK